MLDESPSTEYSCLTQLPDGAVGLLYERSVDPQRYSVEIVFQRRMIDELK